MKVTNLTVEYADKLCFADFSYTITAGSRIAIIGRNGSGKSTLLKMLHGRLAAHSGAICYSTDVISGFVPQVIEDFAALSGGQRVQKLLTQALSCKPTVLLLDEPSNHLDSHNRTTMVRMLQKFSGTLLIATHDRELIRQCIDTIWHIDNGKIRTFMGNYDDYMREAAQQRHTLERSITQLDHQQQDSHIALMQEQQRAAKSKQHGVKMIVQRKWPTVGSPAKMGRAVSTAVDRTAAIKQQKDHLITQLGELRLPEVILPKFALQAAKLGNYTVVSITNGTIAYNNSKPLQENINFAVNSTEHVAIVGNNASGKSTLLKALLTDENVLITGDWIMPKPQDIGYLDQHYANLIATKSVLETIEDSASTWSYPDIRCHLNDFLFRKNKEVNKLVCQLSGGEKARLSLAKIAIMTPKLLLLDEITNNLDIETTQHVIQVLKYYPGAMIIISHDIDFLQEINTRIIHFHP